VPALPKKIKFFKTPADLRKWFESHHADVDELWVGYYKKSSGKPSITWPESVDQALCFGWIDGIRKSVDEQSYAIRFTQRRSRSVWSSVNIKRIQELIEQELVKPPGLSAFKARQEYRSGIYSYEQRKPELEPEYAERMRKNKAAWKFFQSQAPYYRKVANWYVVSAKKEETRLKRLNELIAVSAKGERLRGFLPPKKQK
jgi:uncharacterized protein YdeI (YjbR/CyaY-like superfamily)